MIPLLCLLLSGVGIFLAGYMAGRDSRRPYLTPRTEPPPLPAANRHQIRRAARANRLDITSLPRLHTVDDFDSEDTQR